MTKSFSVPPSPGLSLWITITYALHLISFILPGLASPIDGQVGSVDVGLITVKKRAEQPSSLEKGVVDWELTDAHIAHLHLKYKTGILNYQVLQEKNFLDLKNIGHSDLKKRSLESDQTSVSAYRNSINVTNSFWLGDRLKPELDLPDSGSLVNSQPNSDLRSPNKAIDEVSENGSHKSANFLTRRVTSPQKIPRSLESIPSAVGRNVAQLKEAGSKAKSGIVGTAGKVKDGGHWVIDQPGKIKHRLTSFFSAAKENTKQAGQKVINVSSDVADKPRQLKDGIVEKFQDVKNETSHLTDSILHHQSTPEDSSEHSQQRRLVENAHLSQLHSQKMRREIRADPKAETKDRKPKRRNVHPSDRSLERDRIPVQDGQPSKTKTQQSRHLVDVAMKVSIPVKPQSQSGKIPLIDHKGLLWYGLIQVGNPAKTFRLDFDTGSADLWIPSIDCDSCGKSNAAYNPTQSITSKSMDGVYLDLKYGDGSTTAGNVYRDTVTVAGLTVSQQAFAATSRLGQTFGKEPIDGVLGLAYRSLSAIDESPFFENLVSQKGVAHPIFSFKLARPGSHLYLGGVDPTAYRGDFEWNPVLSRSYWVLLAQVSINRCTALSGLRAIIDTGTTVIVAPPNEAALFWSQIPDSGPFHEKEGYYTYPCNQAPLVDFSFGDSVYSRHWSITTDDLRLGTTGTGSSKKCIGSIVGQDVGLDAWILGDTFLKNVYSSFDIKNHRVGFATLA
ncbi:hypothetical protein CROQUDRAFT_662040 [Cronartium quercuum f. sp. fusiforme G11]|uniref:Peptidase A1 domain-containing protein n=1 Tax=Cronartium quercuum f. sp. fusiforme G11 TaxID=708437 RepID=A0A9P6T871_9BASI|nr:hypothetical protein CROQUDRAFT_662040 [Cronartium quercuum f. sp. fusiforme G11]